MKKTLLSTLIAGLCIASQATHAQQAGFLAEVDSRLTYEDNILRASDANAESDTSLVVAPKLTLAGILGKHRFSAIYGGKYAKYFDNSEVDYDNHNFRLTADFDHSPRFTSEVEFQYKDAHEDFSDLNDIFDGFTEFNRFTEKQLKTRFAYGRQDSFGQLVLRLERSDRDHKNNGQEFRSNERDLASLAFYYRIAPRTRLLAEVVLQDFDYAPPAGIIDLDNEHLVYQAGVEWALTNQLAGTVKVGYQDRDYRLDALRDIDGLSYEADLEWKPNTYTKIGFIARRESIDSSLESAGGFLRTTYGINVSHGLTELTKLEGSVGYAKDELVFTANRQDKRRFIEAGITHNLLYWVELGVNVRHDNRDSTQVSAEYEVNSINLTAKLSFD
jgi:hypothetical protein